MWFSLFLLTGNRFGYILFDFFWGISMFFFSKMHRILKCISFWLFPFMRLVSPTSKSNPMSTMPRAIDRISNNGIFVYLNETSFHRIYSFVCVSLFLSLSLFSLRFCFILVMCVCLSVFHAPFRIDGFVCECELLFKKCVVPSKRQREKSQVKWMNSLWHPVLNMWNLLSFDPFTFQVLLVFDTN